MSRSWVLTVLVAVVFVSSSVLAAPPGLVSPLGLSGERCPTFSWSEVSGAAAYELVVYPVSRDGDVGGQPLVSVRLPGGAGSWTPPVASCFKAGERYAWTLRALGTAEEGGWSEPALFEVDSGPSQGEVEAAIATLRRYLADSRRRQARPGEAAAGELPQADRGAPPRERSVPPWSEAQAPVRGAESLAREAEEGRASTTAASVPALGSPSLTVDANVALGGASNLFKDGSVFLWDGTAGNTALGRLALSSATGTAIRNTAVGREALRFTVEGLGPGYGSYNTAVGHFALRSNTIGDRNTASGYSALFSNTNGSLNTASGYRALFNNIIGNRNTASGSFALLSNTAGFRNTASGYRALSSNTSGFENTAHGDRALFLNYDGRFNTATGARALYNNTAGVGNTASGILTLALNTVGYHNTALGFNALYSNGSGSRNTAVGYRAGFFATTGDDNIFLGSGAASGYGEGHTIRIGGATGAGVSQQNRAFIAGIRGITTGAADAVPVLIDGGGQLGTANSSREVKQDIREVGELSRRLLELRPVAFRYR